MGGAKKVDNAFKDLGKSIEKSFTGSTAEERRIARQERDAAIAKAEADKLAAGAAEKARVEAEAKAAAAESEKLRITEELKKAEAELAELLSAQNAGEPAPAKSSGQAGESAPAGAAGTSDATDTESVLDPATANSTNQIAQAKAKVLALTASLETATLSASESKTHATQATATAHAAQTQAEVSQRAADEAIKKVNSLNSGGVGGAMRGALSAFSNGLEKAVNCISGALKEGLKFISKAVDKLMEIGVTLFMNSPIMLIVKLAAPDVAKKIEKVVEKMADAVGSVIKDTLTAAVSVVDSVGKSMVSLSRGDLDAAGKTMTTGVMDAVMVAATVAGGVMVLAETAVVSALSEVLPPEAAGALGVLATLNPRGAIGSVAKAVDNFIPTAAISNMAGGVKNVASDVGKLVPTTGVSAVAGDVANAAGDIVDKGLVALSAVEQVMPVGELTPMQMLAVELGMGAAASQAPELLEKRRKGKDSGRRDHDDSGDDTSSKGAKAPSKPDESTKADGTDKADNKKNKKSKEDDDKPDRDFDMDLLGLASPMFGGLSGDGMGSDPAASPDEQKQFLANYGGNIAGAARSDAPTSAAPTSGATAKPKHKTTRGVQEITDITDINVAPAAKKNAEVNV
jgi:hypothetical protein